MKAGETICYYRARGGEKSIYVTMLYDKNQLRGSITQKYHPKKPSETKSLNGAPFHSLQENVRYLA